MKIEQLQDPNFSCDGGEHTVQSQSQIPIKEEFFTSLEDFILRRNAGGGEGGGLTLGGNKTADAIFT